MYLPSSRRPNLAPLAMIATLLLLIFWSTRNTPEREYAPLSAYFSYAQASVPQSAVTPLPAAQAAVIQSSTADLRTAQLDVTFEIDAYQNEREQLGQELQTALAYVQQRTHMQLLDRIHIIVTQDATCGFHGITYSDVRIIYIYTCATIPRQRIVNLAAHEYVHQLAHDTYGPAHLQADLILSEGLATWGAGEYWLSGYPSFQAFLQAYQQQHALLDLATHYREVQSITEMNTLYYQWASFVEFLIQTYGREQFDQLYQQGQAQAPGSAPYQAIYGQDLALLQATWQAWLN